MSSGPPASFEPRTLRRLALAAAGFAFLLIGVGALVRASGSGDACPGWPRCFGRWIPPFRHPSGISATNIAIEYSHRLTAFTVFVLVLTVAAVALWRYRGVRRVVRPAVGALGLWLFQAVLGGLVVTFHLTPWLVTAHLATAMVFAGTLVYLVVASYTLDARPDGPPDGLAVAFRVASLAVLALILVGAYVRGEGAGLVVPDWPLMDGRAIPATWSVPVALHFAHRVLAALVGLMVVAAAVVAWRQRARRFAVAALAVTAGVLFAAQVIVGAANVWTRLAEAPVVAHVLLASLIFGSLVAAAATARAVPAPPPAPPARTPVPGSATEPQAAAAGRRT